MSLIEQMIDMDIPIINEARQIFWPWLLMILAGLAPLGKLMLTDKSAEWPDTTAVFGFFGGAAILTALSFRATQKIQSSGPVSAERRNVWARKMLMVTLAVVFASLIVCFTQTDLGLIDWPNFRVEHAFEPVLLLTIIVCSTGFWTLLVRSVVWGILLTGVAQSILYLLLLLFVTLVNRMAPVEPGEMNLAHTPEVHAGLARFIFGFGLSYAAIMLWLGRKRIARQSLAAKHGADSRSMKERIVDRLQ